MSVKKLLHRFNRRRLGIGLGIFAGIVILFGLLGYFWLPGYAKSKLEMALSEMLHRPVTVQSIDIQPYTLELTVRGFRIGEQEAGPGAGNALFSLDELYTNLSIASLARRAPVISSLSLKGPAVRLVREAEQRFNVTDLMEEFLNKPDEGGESMFSVSNITIEGGRFEFVDRVKDSRQEISEIEVGIPFIANFESAEETWVEPRFSARVNGAPLTLGGKLRPFTRNREATLELNFKDIDLTHIDEYSPIPTGMRLLSGYFDSDLLLTFSQADGESPNIALTGRAALKQLEIENRAVEVPYNARLDRLDLSLTEINLSGTKASRAALTLSETAMTREGSPDPALHVPRLSIGEIGIDPARQSVTLDALVLEQVKASLHRGKDGRLNLAKFFAPAADKSRPTPEMTPEKSENGKSWTARLGKLELVESSLRFEDSNLPEVVPMIVEPLDLTVSDIDFSGVAPLKFALKAQINKRGHLDTTGSLAWAPVAADLVIDAQEVDLVALQGWASDQLNVLLARGALSFQGAIKAASVEKSPLKVTVNGASRLTNFSILDKTDASDLLRWRSIDIKNIQFVNEPLNVGIGAISMTDFFAYVVLSPEGELNLKHIVRQDSAKSSRVPVATEPSPLAERKSPADRPDQTVQKLPKPPPPSKPLPVRVGRIVMQGGNIIFQDHFIKPNYRANLTGLAGRIGPLDPRKPGEIDIRGAVDKTAPLKITGKVDTWGKELYLDVTATAKGIDMPTFSPYSGKYVGYAIEKGKLSVDIHYHVEKGELSAENNIFLDQLIFGEKIESPDALSIPVNLALAVLQNRRGEIDVHLPISGSINDPEFSLGGVIIQAVLNLLTKAVTAPFALLGSLFGGEELSQADFLPGDAQITAESEKRLETLSQALIDRPAIKLEITGWADPLHDPEALKRRILERRIKALKVSADIKKGEARGPLDEIELSPEEYEKYLTVLYKDAKFEKPKNVIGFAKGLPVPEMEKLLLANTDAGDDELRELAEVRATNARNWLIEKGGVPGERIFVLEPKIERQASSQKSASRAEFSLR